jgi:membrane protease subunit HflK
MKNLYSKLFSIWDDPESFSKNKKSNKFNFDDFSFNFNSNNNDLFNFKNISLALLGFFVMWMLSGFYKVDESDQAVVFRFGKFNRIANPGLNYHLPEPIESIVVEKVHFSRRIEIGYRSQGSKSQSILKKNDSTNGLRNIQEESVMLTGDENVVNINLDIRWRIKDLKNYVLNIPDPFDLVKSSSESAAREIVGKTNIQNILSNQKQEIVQQITITLQKILDSFDSGVLIENVELLKAEPPIEVIESYRDVQSARADREKIINQAYSYKNDIIPRARGEGEQIIQKAEGYKQEVIARAEGDVKRFKSVYDVYKQNKAIATEMLKLDTIEAVMKNSKKVIVSNDNLLPHLDIAK